VEAAGWACCLGIKAWARQAPEGLKGRPKSFGEPAPVEGALVVAGPDGARPMATAKPVTKRSRSLRGA